MQHPTDVEDTDGHGTRSRLAAAPANGMGTVGASPYSNLLVVRTIPDNLGGMTCALNYLAAFAGRSELMVVNALDRSTRDAVRGREAGLYKLMRRGALLGRRGRRRDHSAPLDFPATPAARPRGWRGGRRS